MQRFENGSDICGFRNLNNSASKRVLNLLEPVKLTVWKVVIVKLRMHNEGCNGAGCSEVKIWADTAKFTDVIVARFRKCRDLVRESKVFVKNKAEVPSGVGIVVREESCILENLEKSIRRNLVLEELRV